MLITANHTGLATAFVPAAAPIARLPAASPATFRYVVGAFVLAFITFFGVPFVSIAPHKGVV